MAKQVKQGNAVKAKATSTPTNLVQRVTLAKRPAREFPNFTPGDTVNVYVRVREGEKERVQLYRGVVIKIQGSGMGRSFTVRKMSSGVGVERTFPYQSPAIDRVELVSTGNVRRAKLLYLRNLKGKAATIQGEAVSGEAATGVAATAEKTPEAAQ